jgi:glutamine synthetase
VHKDSIGDHFEVFIAAGAQGAPSTMDTVLPETGLTPVGEVALVPDWNTLRALPFAPGHARVMCDMHKDGHPWELCPRELVRRLQRELQSQHGMMMTAAFENEFYLLRPEGHFVDQSNFASTYSLNRHRVVLDEIIQMLLGQRMGVQQFHAEAGPGQLEISVHHAGALHAADHQVAVRETVHAVAEQHGLRANFLPKPFPDQAGNGCHLHVGLEDQEGHSRLDKPLARQFMAGVLEHLDALVAITAGLPNSHLRLVPNSWSGAYRCWGVQNREAALRLPASPGHFELKAVDATANPYLAVAGVLACGLNGILRQLELPRPYEVDPFSLPEDKRPPRLPTSASQALDAFERDPVLPKAFGPALTKAFVAVRRAEVAMLEQLGPEGEVRLLSTRF